jgi:tetratricopeptide (TPR) repeat protein
MQRIYVQIRISCLAAGIFCHAAQAAEQQLTPEQEQRVEESERYHTQTLDLLHTGKYAEAIAPAQQALEIRRASLGENHPYTPISYSTLAEAYRLNRKLTEAETNCRKALAIRQKVLEPNDSSLATSYNNLATIVQSEGKYAEAASLHLKALAIWEKVHGADHVMLGSVLNKHGRITP